MSAFKRVYLVIRRVLGQVLQMLKIVFGFEEEEDCDEEDCDCEDCEDEE